MSVLRDYLLSVELEEDSFDVNARADADTDDADVANACSTIDYGGTALLLPSGYEQRGKKSSCHSTMARMHRRAEKAPEW